MEVIDLSIEVDEDTRVPTIDTGISDPPVRFEPWVEVAHKGFRITKIEMGAHAGTHCDVPAHWVVNGRAITDYPVDYWVGWAVIMDFCGTGPISVEKIMKYKDRIAHRRNIIPVLLNNFSDVLTEAARREFLSWNPQAVVMGEGINTDENFSDSTEFLRAGVAMIMNADRTGVAKLRDNDLIVAAPIRFLGLEAAPVRLIAIRGLMESAPGPASVSRSTLDYENQIARLERKVGQLTLELEAAKGSATKHAER